jgi:hypothetical protein
LKKAHRVLVATFGVADLADKVDCNIEREILRNSTKIFISVVISAEEKEGLGNLLCKLCRFSAAVLLVLQVGTPHGRPLCEQLDATLLITFDGVLHGQATIKHGVSERGIWQDIGNSSEGREFAQ